MAIVKTITQSNRISLPAAGEDVPAPIADDDFCGGGGKNDYWRPETEELRRQYREMGWGCSKCRWKGTCSTCYSRLGEDVGEEKMD